MIGQRLTILLPDWLMLETRVLTVAEGNRVIMTFTNNNLVRLGLVLFHNKVNFKEFMVRYTKQETVWFLGPIYKIYTTTYHVFSDQISSNILDRAK